MSPKLLLTYPHREEDQGIDLAPLFLLKLLSNKFKSVSNLTFSEIFWLFCLFLFTLNFAETAADSNRKRTDILVLKVAKMWIFKVHYLWLKKFDTKINAILAISELKASVGKVLRRFCCSGEKFISGLCSLLYFAML